MQRMENSVAVAAGSAPAALVRAEGRAAGLGRLIACSAVAVAGVYALRLALLGHPEIWKGYFLKEHGVLERAEALVWIPAVVLNCRLLAASVRARRDRVRTGWLLGLSLLVIFALGEEIGWGQHLFGFEPSGWLLENNLQKDTTLHNLDFGGLLGLDRDTHLHRVVRKAIRTAPYVFCIALWVGLPLLRRTGRVPILRRIPLPRDPIVAFFAANVVVYLVIDFVFADVGEIFELVIALVFTLVALDVWVRRERVAGEGII